MTEVARRGLNLLMELGVMTVNQSPIVGDINDDPEVLAELMRRLSFIGVPPYYFFQCRPTEGNKPFDIPIVHTYSVLEDAKRRLSGLAKRVRLVMSHELGKIEIVGVTDSNIFCRFHRARYVTDEGRFMVFRRNDRAYWLDDLEMADGSPHPCQEERGEHWPTPPPGDTARGRCRTGQETPCCRLGAARVEARRVRCPPSAAPYLSS